MVSGAGTGSSTGAAAGSPRVLVARSAIAAAAIRKMLQAMSARWKPAVSASGWAACVTSRWWVREVAITEKIASPNAPPTHVDVLTKAAASPALSGGTPALAAVLTPTKTNPRPNDMITSPGSRSPTYEPCTGMRESQYTAPAEISAPETMIGRVPTWEKSC